MQGSCTGPAMGLQRGISPASRRGWPGSECHQFGARRTGGGVPCGRSGARNSEVAGYRETVLAPEVKTLYHRPEFCAERREHLFDGPSDAFLAFGGAEPGEWSRNGLEYSVTIRAEFRFSKRFAFVGIATCESVQRTHFCGGTADAVKRHVFRDLKEPRRNRRVAMERSTTQLTGRPHERDLENILRIFFREVELPDEE